MDERIKKLQDEDVTAVKVTSYLEKLVKNARSSYTPHDLLLGHNLKTHLELSNVDQVQHSYGPFPLHSTMPVPLNAPAPVGEDAALKDVRLKQEWKTKIQRIRSKHEGLQRSSKKKKLKEVSRSPAVVPTYVVTLAELLHEDPDPYFDSCCNWYLMGSGNIHHVKVQDSPCLLQAANHQLYVYKYEGNEENNEVQVTHTVKNKQVIYETMYSQTNDRSIVAMRQKYNIFLLKLEKGAEDFQLEHFHSLNFSIPLTSLAVNDSQTSLYYICADGSVNLYDLNVETSVQLNNQTSTHKVIDNWSSVQIMDENIIFITNKNAVKIFDVRTKRVETKIHQAFHMHCEELSASKISEKGMNCFYSVSTHGLYLYDLRSGRDTEPEVTKWSIDFKSRPFYVQTEMLSEQDELVCLGSQISGESCLVLNRFSASSDDTKMEISEGTFDNFMPKYLLSINDTFKKAQLMGHCLNPATNLKQNCKASTTGLALYFDVNNQLNLLTANSFGDVFKQKLLPYKTDEDFEGAMKMWESKFDMEPFEFEVTSLTNMKECFKTMQKRGLPKTRLKAPRSSLFKNRSLQYLRRYGDITANELLGMWDIEEPEKEIDGTVLPAPNTTVAVNSWMADFPSQFGND